MKFAIFIVIIFISTIFAKPRSKNNEYSCGKKDTIHHFHHYTQPAYKPGKKESAPIGHFKVGQSNKKYIIPDKCEEAGVAIDGMSNKSKTKIETKDCMKSLWNELCGPYTVEKKSDL